jgi:hypothetical protein
MLFTWFISRPPTPPTPAPPAAPRLWVLNTFKPKSAIPKSKIALFLGSLTVGTWKFPQVTMAPSHVDAHCSPNQGFNPVSRNSVLDFPQ